MQALIKLQASQDIFLLSIDSQIDYQLCDICDIGQSQACNQRDLQIRTKPIVEEGKSFNDQHEILDQSEAQDSRGQEPGLLPVQSGPHRHSEPDYDQDDHWEVVRGIVQPHTVPVYQRIILRALQTLAPQGPGTSEADLIIATLTREICRVDKG